LALVPQQKLFDRLREEGCAEAVLLSTCNRFELYLAGEDGKTRPPSWAVAFLERETGVSLSAHAYLKAGPTAVSHLFEVAAGLDSLVVGETEILGQVKTAYENAVAARMTGKQTNVLFQRALYVGKKVRNDTAIAVGQTSVASVAVQLAETIFGSLAKSEVLVLGAGAMAELTARHLMSKKVSRLCISNRTWERAAGLAGQLKADAVPWEKFPSHLAQADIVVCSTGAPSAVIDRAMVEKAVVERGGRSLFLIDIAMPRDVDESVHGVEHVYLYRLNDLEAIVADNMKNRGDEIARARALARDKADEFCAWARSVESGQELSLKHAQRVP
jgi:glutamyl-tRNA reductase